MRSLSRVIQSSQIDPDEIHLLMFARSVINDLLLGNNGGIIDRLEC